MDSVPPTRSTSSLPKFVVGSVNAKVTFDVDVPSFSGFLSMVTITVGFALSMSTVSEPPEPPFPARSV